MRIAITGPYFYPQNYGIEKVMYAHAKYLAQRGNDVTVFSSKLKYPDGVFADVPDRETLDGFSIIRLSTYFRSLGRYFSYPSNGGILIMGLVRSLRALAPDIVHAHNVGAAAWANGAALHCKQGNAKLFYSVYHHPGKLRFDAIRKAPLRYLNRLPLQVSSKIFLQTDQDRSHILSDYDIGDCRKLVVLENGVEPALTARQKGQVDGRTNILFVGRVEDKRKGFDILASAIANLGSEYKNRILLRVVGTISEGARMRLLASFGTCMRVSGNVSEAELEEAYAEADIFVMPSYYEGFGMPFIEAMRYGVAVIGTRVGGIPEIVPDDTGILISPGNAEELRYAIERMISERSYAAFGARGKAWVKKFEWSKVVEKLERHYIEALEGRQIL